MLSLQKNNLNQSKLITKEVIIADNNKKYKSSPAIEIIIWLLIFLTSSCICFILPGSLNISRNSFAFSSLIIIYILHSCLLGLIIGCAISYGLEEGRYSNKKNLFILILFYSFLTFFKYAPDFKVRLVPIFYFCLVYLGIGGFILYKKTRYSQLLSILTILGSFLLYSVISAYYIYKKYSDYNTEMGIHLTHITLLYCCFLTINIIETILHKKNKIVIFRGKFLFIQIILYSFFTYICFSIISYILSPSEINSLGFCYFLHYKLEREPGFIFFYYNPSGFYNPLLGDYYRDMIGGYIIRFYEIITLGKLHISSIYIIINIQIWISEFVITSLCAWQFIKFTCPCLSSLDCSGIRKQPNPDNE